MGGRGASTINSGQKAVIIDYGSGRKSSFRVIKDGRITNMEKNEVIDTNGLSIDQIATRAEQMGYTVTRYNNRQLKQLDKSRAEEQKKNERVDYELGYGTEWGNKEYRKTARASRMMTRMNKRTTRVPKK